MKPGCSDCKLGQELEAKHPSEHRCVPDEGEPGGLLLVGEGPGQQESSANRCFVGKSGQYLRGLVKKWWKGPVALSNATRCRPVVELGDKHIDACRGYLAQTLREAQPQRVVALGNVAAQSLLGRTTNAMSVRGGYGWLRGWGCGPVPVYLLLHPAAALRNRFVKAAFEEDLKVALMDPVPPMGPWDQEVILVEDAASARWAAAEVRARCRRVAFDVETAGQMWTSGFRIISTSLSDGENGVWVWTREAMQDPGARAELLSLLVDPRLPKTGSNVKYDELAFIAAYGARVSPVVADARIWRKLQEPEASGALGVMAELVGMGGMKEEQQAAMTSATALVKRAQKKAGGLEALGLEPETEAALRLGEPVEGMKYELVRRDVLHRYNARDAVATGKLVDLLERRFAEPANAGPSRIWEAISGPASRALVAVEEWGVGASEAAIRQFDQYLEQKELAAKQVLDKHAPGVNWNSPAQVANLLYGQLGLRTSVTTKKGGKPSTSEEALVKLAGKHPIPSALMDHRYYAKLRGAYGLGMLQYLVNDRIHANIKIDGARCLPAGELVLTSRGYLPVEQVRVGDLVLSHEGVPRPITATFANPARATIRVGLENGLSLRTTEDHEYMTQRGWVQACSLRLGDLVQTHSEPEQWRPVPEWPYEVSSWGRVRHLRPRTTKARPLAFQQKYKGTVQGHLKATLYRGDGIRRRGNRRDFGIHQLVLKAFGPDVPKVAKLEGRHLNGIPWDNTVGNLAWGTAAENRSDAVAHGADFARYTRVLSAEDVAYIRAQPRKPHGGAGRWTRVGVSDVTLAARYGVSREQIRDIRSGKKWLDPRPPEERAAARRAKFRWSPVATIEAGPEAANFGLSVDQDHSHVTAGIVTHNSGRCSVVDPALQTIPRAENVEGVMARDCFVAPPGYLLVELDFRQIEFKIAAMLSGDPKMLELIKLQDPHTEMARLISRVAWGIPPEAVTKEHRSKAKTVVFGVLYGKGAWGLAEEWGCKEQEAQAVIDAMFGELRVLRRWTERQVQECRRTGEVATVWDGRPARRRPNWAVADGDDKRRRHAEHVCVNSPVQGTANDYCLASLAATVEWVQEDAVPGTKLVLPVHDALLLEVRADMVPEVANTVAGIMRGWPTDHGVRLDVECKVGPSWGRLQPYDLEAA